MMGSPDAYPREIPIPFIALVYLLDAVGGSITWSEADLVGFDINKYMIWTERSYNEVARTYTMRLEERSDKGRLRDGNDR